jgi:hypothetical protein
MSVEEAINSAADQAARTARMKLQSLDEDIRGAENHLAWLRNQRAEANTARSRRATFQAKIGNDYLCPQCWIVEKERRSVLLPRPSETSDDIFVCRHCGYEIISPG